MNFHAEYWQNRLDELRAEYHVPGAALAVLADGTLHELASGVLNLATGVEVTPDSVFLSGSTAKIYTATLIMQLVDAGKLDLDTPVVGVLPEFATPDPEATRQITVRQLLSHTGGVTNDFNHDSGRGDDCLARYVEAARSVPLDCTPGTSYSYGSLGYAILGRVVETLTGTTWDRAHARIRYEFIDGMKHYSPPIETGLTAVSPLVFAATGGPSGEDYTPVVFGSLADGTPCVYVSMRATPEVG